jgi:hypothetical protein
MLGFHAALCVVRTSVQLRLCWNILTSNQERNQGTDQPPPYHIGA